MITRGDDISEEGDTEYPVSLQPPPQFRDSPPLTRHEDLTPAPPPRHSLAPARQTVHLLASSPPVKVESRASDEGPHNQVQNQRPTSSPALSRRSFSVMDLREKFSSGVNFQKPRVQREDSFSHIPEDLRQFFRKDRQQ